MNPQFPNYVGKLTFPTLFALLSTFPAERLNGRLREESPIDMELGDNPDTATRALKRAHREKRFKAMINVMGFLCYGLESGESIEEIAIDVDISAAGGALPEAWHGFLREALEQIRIHRARGAGRNEVMLRLRKEIISLARMLGAGRDEVMTYAGKAQRRSAKSPKAKQLVFGFAEQKR